MMLRMITILSLLLLVVSPCFAEPAKRLQANTVVLTDGYGHGSGVLFSRDRETFIWTAGHVADIWMNSDGTYDPIPVVQGGRLGAAEVLRVGDYEAGVDVALLRVTEGDFKGDAEFYRGFNDVKVGQKVIHCGTPLDKDWNERLIAYGRFAYVDRLVEGRPLLEPRRIDQVDITAYPGCSGGPVVDEETGGIVGLLVMGSSPRLTIIEPTRHIYKWAKEHDCLWAFDRMVDMPGTPVAWPGDRFLRQVRDRYCPSDGGWGTLPPSPEPEPEPSLEEQIEAILGDLLEKLLPNLPEYPVEPTQPVEPVEPKPTPAPEPVEPPAGNPEGDVIIIDIPSPDDYEFLPYMAA